MPKCSRDATRSFTIAGQCGIPSGAAAVSFNFGALNVGGAGDLRVFPAGGGVPLVSTLNYTASTPNIANAAIVPLGAGGAITVQADAVAIDLIIDVNGYYASAPATSSNAFLIINSGFFAMLGETTSTANGAVAIYGDAHGTSGQIYGVKGQTRSTTSGAAGVYGVDGSGDPIAGSGAQNLAGVRGGSRTGAGVIGVSSPGAFSYGVAGVLVDSAGNTLSAGILGYHSDAGIYFVNGLAGSGTKSFIEPHPTDASKVVRYVSLEGREAGTYFRGRSRFQRGLATVEVPEDFRMVTDPESLSIQVTPIGELTTVAVMRIGLDGIVVKGSRDVEFFYLVNGIRRAYNHWDPIQPNEKFFVPESPDAKLPKYLSEEERGRLIANGTYNVDGTVNKQTAERLGWAKAWADRQAATEAGASGGR